MDKNRIIGKVLEPIMRDCRFFLLLMFLNYIPSLSFWVKNYCPHFRYYGILALPAVFFATYVLCLLLNLFQFKYRRYIKYTLFSLSYIITIIESYIIIFFGTRFNSMIITLCLETNPSEASGFITTFINTPSFVKYALSVLCLSVFLLFINKNSIARKIDSILNKSINNIVVKIGLLFVIVLFVAIGTWREGRNLYWHKYNIDEIGRVRKHSFYSTSYLSFSCLYEAVRLYWLSTYDLPILIKTLENTELYDCKYKSKNIILIIGESYSKHHSSLYGYSLKTNPLLENENNLYVFKDVITTDAVTSQVMKNIFTFRDKHNDMYWAKSTLFPRLFKKAGYHCAFVSNQEVEGENTSDVYNMANDYLANPKTKSLLWDVMNSQKCQYDMQLVCEYAKTYQRDDSCNLAIFHLIGQHTAYQDRYPAEKTVFTESDYKYRTNLTEYQRSVVAHYDNAIAYCDEVLKSIIDLYRDDDAIVIFLSDHGEEVYDYRDYAGRSHEPTITVNMAKYIYEVPFFIWMSDKYKEVHPDVVRNVEQSIYKPFATEDLPHLLLDLAGIKCEMFDPSRSLLNDKYISRKRLIGESKQDYDALVK